MTLVEPKTMIAFLAGGALAIGAWSVGAASAASPPTAAPPAAAAPAAAAPALAPAVTIPVVGRACANKRTGALSVIRAGTAKKKCAATEVMVAWPAPPPAPPSLLAKDGSLRLTSPNKAYLLVLNNDGVGIRGPGGAILVDATSIKQFDSTGKQK